MERAHEDLQKILDQADVAWQDGDTNLAIQCYDKALKMVQLEENSQTEGEILLGKGFALMSLHKYEDALLMFQESKKIAMRFENRAQIQFVENLISEAQSKSRCGGSSSQNDQEASSKDAVNDSIQRSFARNFVHKELVVMVMSDETESLDKAFNVQIMTALKTLHVACEYFDVSNNESLEQAFKKEFDLKTLPILFVGGKSLGDREEVAELAKQEKLKDAILSALPETICEEEKKQLFAAVDPCETSENCTSKHKERLLRMVFHVSQKVCSRPHPPSYDEDLIQYFEKCQNITIQGIVNSFIQEISQLLGNFPLPVDLLKQAPTPVKIVEFIEEHCPAQGDCQKCPSKMNCKIHEENSTDVVDIEDFGKPH
uniref:Glutaredoxin domain-containing protein n=1 Tax=Hanusia phi TaxID=3032 RepID=A0A7S0EE80_9CRYP|mmetsp:Transcript_22696/g.51166  ORF Transcript_22696/g.51166 Transcript_22696/m.51166 type:complete len:372 (+) Transcript_22696:127-1242(+)